MTFLNTTAINSSILVSRYVMYSVFHSMHKSDSHVKRGNLGMKGVGVVDFV